MKALIISVFLFVFALGQIALGQTTGFVLTDSAKITGTSCILSDTAVSGKSYRFDIRGTYIGPDSLSSHAVWAKVYNQAVTPPVKIIFDLLCPSYSGGIRRIAFGLDNDASSRMQATSGTGFLYVYPNSGWTTKTLQVNGSGAWRRMGIALSLPQTETGYRVVFIDNIRYVTAAGDTVMLDDGNPTIQPPVPTLILPANGATSVSLSPTFVFFSVTGASRYWVQVTNFSGTVVWSDSNVTSATVTAPANAFANNTTYYWRVKAYGGGAWSDWSSVWSFTTIVALPDPPILGTPVDGATNTLVDVPLTWDIVPGATLYQAQVSRDTNVVFNQTTLNTSIIPTGLVCGATYMWKVRAQNQAGWGAWSSVRTFSTVLCVTVPDIPILVSPADGAMNQPVNVLLLWGSASGATSYGVQVATDSGFTSLVFNQSSLAGLSISPSGLMCGTTYYWRVNASNSAGTGGWSATRSFSTVSCIPNPPELVSPPDGAINVPLTPTFTWTGMYGMSYRIQVLTPSGNVVFETTTTNPGVIVSSALQCNTTYYWRVKAGNSSGWSDWSSSWRFTTVGCIPEKVSLLLPFNNETGVSLTPTLFWWSSRYSATYHLQVGENSTFLPSPVVEVDGITVIAQEVQLQKHAFTYYWRVRGIASNGTPGPWSNIWNFMTIGTTGVKPDKVPDKFALHQNYPNPFNPSTTIKFELPINSFVALKVYDILGNEIATLVEEGEKLAGVYEISFDASKLPTGTYIYRLSAGDFVETKKMILMK